MQNEFYITYVLNEFYITYVDCVVKRLSLVYHSMSTLKFIQTVYCTFDTVYSVWIPSVAVLTGRETLL